MSLDDASDVSAAHPEVAIVGLSCRFPGANGPAEFWKNLREGASGISFFTDEELAAAGIPPESYGAPNYVKAHGNLDGYDLFDAGFFGYAPREAEIIDPQQRLFLETAWEAIENAGYDPSHYPGIVGVYAGATMSHYLLALHPLRDKLAAIGIDITLLGVGNDKDSLAPRLSYKLDLRGPAVTVQTACSTSLVAVHMACQSLLSGEIDLGLAGAVSVTLPMTSGYFHQEGGILSPDGTCRPFDARAAGTVFGCGLGIVALKRLDDALRDGDTIWGVIKGSAVNNDGASKAGFTAPSVPGQAEVIAEALANAGLTADEIGFVEAHGTATAMGDPIEIAALSKAFRLSSKRTGYCAVGSVKGNLGHLEVAAGMAGLVKAVLAVREGEIPPTLHYDSPNPQIDFASSPFYVNDALAAWPEGPRYAGVSSFGFGGTNAHVVVGEAPAPRPASPPLRPWQLLTVSGRSAAAAERAARNLAQFLADNPRADLADVAYTLQVGRRAFEHRRALACQSAAQARTALLDPIEVATGLADGHERPVYFLFPGQGAQHPGMARLTYRTEPVFRAEFDRVAALFRPHLEALAPETPDLALFVDPGPDAPADLQPRLNKTEVAQPALFAVCYALAKLWESWGVRPKAMLGHSLGEYVAATVAGVLTLDDAVGLVALRARLMAGLPAGDMAAIPRSESDLLPRLPPAVSIAAVHGADLCVVSGDSEAVAKLIADFEAEGLECPKLHTSHAFHSAMMDPVVAEIEQAAAKLALKAPKIPYVSDITGRFITPAEATDPAYWGRQLRATVRLGDGFGTLLGKAGAALLEVGPAQALSSLARQHAAKTASHTVLASYPHPKDPRDDLGALLHALGGLWAHGVEVDWQRFHEGEERRRVPLPTYPFERQRYFLDAAALAGVSTAAPRSLVAPQPQPATAPAAAAPPPAAQATPPTPAAPSKDAQPQLKAGRADSYVDVRYSEDEGSYIAPKDEIEEILADMWQTLLGIARVGTADNFFRLNGNSLIALQAIARIQAVFGVKLSVRAFFETPTVAQLARLIRERQPGLEELVAKARIFEGEAPAPAPSAPSAPAAEVPAAAPAAAQAPREPAPAPVPERVETPDGSMRFSLFFFSGDEAMYPEYKYKLIVDGAKFADRAGFTAIWTPERHFHAFGGLYPNPSVLSASLALVTERLKLRSGSVVLPLHHPIRVAEEWSVVDNLSRGRVGLSFASGFHPHDFVFAPDSFENRRPEMFEKIEAVRHLWRGEKMRVRGGAGHDIDVEIFPKPVQAELPIWVTCSNDPWTFEKTGSIGGNVLTSLIGMTFERLTERIALYRESRAKAGFDPATGEVAVMIHTFVGRDLDKVKDKVRDPFCHYLRSHTALLTSLAKSLHKGFDAEAFSKEDLEELLLMEFERYFKSGSLLGTPDSCLEMVRRLSAIGVNEVGCLLDFGVDVPSMLESLQYLDELRRMAAAERVAVA